MFTCFQIDRPENCSQIFILLIPHKHIVEKLKTEIEKKHSALNRNTGNDDVQCIDTWLFFLNVHLLLVLLTHFTYDLCCCYILNNLNNQK